MPARRIGKVTTGVGPARKRHKEPAGVPACMMKLTKAKS